MKTLLAYYSFSGTTRALCENLSGEDIELVEIKELKRFSTPAAYTKGCFKAMKGRSVPISGLGKELGHYDLLVLACPIWAGNLAPAGVAFLEKAAAASKPVTVIGVSKSGSDCSENINRVAAKLRLSLKGVHNVKPAGPITVGMFE